MKNIKKVDKTLLIFTIIYSILGLVMIFSASSASTILRYRVDSNYFFLRQLLVVIVGYIAGFILLFIPTKKLKKLVYFALIGVVALLILVLVKGKITNNAQSWLRIGAFNLQPSEFAKTILIVYFACSYDTFTNHSIKNISVYFFPLSIAAVMTFLIIIQPDWGSAAILCLIAGLTFISLPIIKKNFHKIIKIGIGVIGVAIAFIMITGTSVFSEEKLSRFNFKNPCSRYQEDTGYQVCNGLIAISNGGLLGKGLGKSTQKYLYLPESHTDFIFPIICEELGSIVGALIIIGYSVILLKLFRIASQADNLRTSIIAYGTFWYFSLHILINLLGILALIPLTGVPLPFLSYGGSYTLNAIIMMFLVQRVSIENKENKIKRDLEKI